MANVQEVKSAQLDTQFCIYIIFNFVNLLSI